MDAEFEQHLNAIPWADFDTAYGPAVDVPGQLKLLAGSDRQAALDATHELWCGLCHQHVHVGSAALPALPFLLRVLDDADREISIELLDILLGLDLGRRATMGRQRYDRPDDELAAAGQDPPLADDRGPAARPQLPSWHQHQQSGFRVIGAFEVRWLRSTATQRVEVEKTSRMKRAVHRLASGRC